MLAPVRVVAITNAFTMQAQEWIERPGASLASIAEKLSSHFRRSRIALLLNGVPIDPNKWSQTRTKSGDLVNLKVVPTFGNSAVGTGAGLLIGGLSLAAMWFLGRGGSNSSSSSTANNTIAQPVENPPDPPVAPADNYGGPGDTIMPAITGFKNRKNNFGPIPSPYGKPVKVFPVKVADEYFLTEGAARWCYVVLCCGIGPMDIANVKVGDRPIEDLVAQNLVVWEKREGKPADINTPLTIYTRDVNQIQPGVTLDYNVAQVQTMGQDAPEISVDLIFPNGLYKTDLAPTYDLQLLNSLGQPSGTVNNASYTPTNPYSAQTCNFLIEYRLHGTTGAWTSFNLPVTDNTTAQKVVGTSWTVATAGIYDVKITKTTSDAIVNSDEVVNVNSTVIQTIHHHYAPTQAAQWVALKSIKTAAPINNNIRDVNGNKYPLGLIALKIKESELTNGEIEDISCEVTRYLKTYDGAAWTDPVITNSPAWAFADVVTGFINDGRLSASYVNPAEIKAWAEWCALKGLTYTKSVDEFTSPEDLLEEIAAHGLASFNIVDGVFRVVVDNERSAIVQMFSNASTNNVEWGFDCPDYPHGVKIKFRNPSADWAVDERTVYADGYDANNATDFESYDYAGMTDPAAAWIVGRRLLAAGEQRVIRYDFDCDMLHICCKRGDLVGLNFDESFDGLGNALITAVTDDGVNVTAVTLDQPVTMEAGKTYGLQIKLSDNSIVAKQVNTVAGEQFSLTLTAPMPLASIHPARRNEVAFGELGQELKLCLVESIEHNEDLSAHLACIEYAPNVQLADTGPVPAYTPNVNIKHAAQVPVIEAPVVLGLVSDETVLLEAPGALITRIQVSLSPPASSIGFMQAEYRETGTESWQNAFTGPASTDLYIVGPVDRRTYDIRISYQSRLYPGLSSAWTVVSGHYVVGQSSKPPDVKSFWIQGDEALLKYDADAGISVPKDHAGYVYRWAQGNTAEWESMLPLGTVTTQTRVSLLQLPPGTLTLAVKAIDRSGNESENAAFLYKNVTGTLMANQFLSYSEADTGWSGTKTNFTQNGNELWADPSANLFWGPSGSLFWSGNPSALVYGTGYLTAVYEFKYVPPADLAKPYKVNLKLTSDGTPSGTPLIDADVYFVEYKRNSQAKFYKDDGSLPFWGSSGSAFYPVDAATGVWLPMPQEGLDGAHEEYTFRITCLANSARRPKLLPGIGPIIDVPDVLEDVEVVCAAGTGTALTLTSTFREVRQVQVSLQRDAINYPDARSCDYELGSIAPYIPTVRVYDAAGAVVAGKVLATVRGV